MSYIKTIVNYINDQLNAVGFCNISSKNIVGLAQLLPRYKGDKLELIPSYVDNDGEAVYIGPDDVFDLIAYHRVNGITVGRANLPAFGDAKQVDANSVKMSLVVFGLRNRLRMSNDDLAMRIQVAFPEAASKQILNGLQFRASNINITDIVLNDLQVFQEEFQGAQFFLKPEQFLFKVNYNIESAFLKKCFNNDFC